MAGRKVLGPAVIARRIAPILPAAAMLLAAGCGCSAQESKFIYMNNTDRAAVVRIDGSMFFIPQPPYQPDSYCLDRSTPHVVSITFHQIIGNQMGPPVGSETFRIIWKEPEGWVEQSGDVGRAPVISGPIPEC